MKFRILLLGKYLPVIGLMACLLPAVSNAADESKSERFVFSGDLRLRYDSADEETLAKRDRARFRTRLGFVAKVNEEISATIRIATGGNDPVSTNQSFDDGFSSKDLAVDLAYIDWKASDELHVFAGKMKNPLFMAGNSGLLWDGDLTPEGAALQYKSGGFFGTVVGWVVEERSNADNSSIIGAQGGYSVGIDEGKLTAAVGYFDYSNTIGNAPFYDGSAKGNSVDTAGNLLLDYRLLEVSAQYAISVRELPLTLFADWVRNTEADVEDTGYTIGFSIGDTRKQGKKQFSWAYQDLEADAVVGTFTDSDFGGGGTDLSGHVFRGKYALRDKVALGLTYILADVDEFAGNEHDYNRYLLDIEFKF